MSFPVWLKIFTSQNDDLDISDERLFDA